MGGPVTAGRSRFSQALAAFDPVSIVASLSDDVTIRVAVHDEPLQGKDTAAFLFGVRTRELTPLNSAGRSWRETQASSGSRPRCAGNGPRA